MMEKNFYMIRLRTVVLLKLDISTLISILFLTFSVVPAFDVILISSLLS